MQSWGQACGWALPTHLAGEHAEDAITSCKGAVGAVHEAKAAALACGDQRQITEVNRAANNAGALQLLMGAADRLASLAGDELCFHLAA